MRLRLGGAGSGAREGEEEGERWLSRLGREEEVGVEIRGMRRPVMEASRGLAMVDMLEKLLELLERCCENCNADGGRNVQRMSCRGRG